MSDAATTPEAAKLSLLQQFIQQRDAFIQQGAQLSTQWQQVQGAIFACNQMIAKIEEDAKVHMEEMAKNVKENLANKDNQGENVDGKTNSEQAEQAS
jgi:hypothetical protein